MTLIKLYFTFGKKIFDMKSYLLIANRYKVWGWLIFIISTIVCVYLTYFVDDFSLGKFEITLSDNIIINGNIFNTIFLVGIFIGLLMICFSSEKQEDEYISQLRLKSWQWAVLISYAILIIACATIYGLDFLNVMAYNMFTIPIVFIFKFYWSLYKFKRQGLKYEE